ncbi:MAG TPA: AraC family transcriptional regulator [Candidatus Choladousia intestinavium]|uniref:AraC family transcriptional regulator n=1 Tax=Candidatus Choladousia intestinavium TaxID=2840727 RepID=A0A9D1AG68_9FIRM|nr:AraC family transcriptional regulator [Candidatus Choladousia intestinavium]
MEWLKNLGAAIDYIEENLDQEVSCGEAARIAGCSPSYFQRIFSYISGVSLAKYIQRRRMTQAAFELQRTDSRILDIALKYGYSSPSSFTRAFQSVHGITPMSAKKAGCTLRAYPPIHFSVEITAGSGLSYRVEEKESFRIVGLRTPLTESMDENMRNIPRFWKETREKKGLAAVMALSSRPPEEILGVSVYRGQGDFYYYIAVSSDLPAPAGMYAYTVPAAEWVVFENNGFFKEDVQRVFRRFLQEFLPFSGYEYAGLPDVEVYPALHKPSVQGCSQVWIAVKRGK